MAGALPSSAIPYKARLPQYKSLLPALKAELKMTAFTTLGRPLIPQSLIAITHGLADPPTPLVRRGSLGYTRRPIRNVPKT